jgi:hypothetical protein
MTGARIAARAVDFFQDNRGLGDAEAGSSVFLRDEGGKIAGLGERVYEGFRIFVFSVVFLPISGGKPAAQVPHSGTQFFKID